LNTINKIIVYTNKGCPRCEQVKKELKDIGLTYEERMADDLMSGKYKDVEAMAELQMNDGELPVLTRNGIAVTTDYLYYEMCGLPESPFKEKE
jgi:glutaredoxin